MPVAVAEKTTRIKIKIPIPNSEKQSAFVWCTNLRQIVKAGRQWGKAQPLDSLIYTPDGPKRMGDMSVGDVVLTPTGKAIVEEIYPQGIVDIYRVSFGDGSYAECSGDHLWEICERRVDSRWKQRTRVVSTKEISTMASLHGENRKPTLPEINPAQFDEKPVPINPYLLGVLIGDGMMRHDSVVLSAYDEYIRKRVEFLLPDGYKLHRVNSEKHDYRIRTKNGGPNEIVRALKSLGLWGKYSYEKFIPDIYKYNSEDIRLEIIRGILDTDGWVNHVGQAILEQTSVQLAKDVCEIMQSLGGSCTTSTKKGGYKVNGEYKATRQVYKQTILFDDAKILFSIPHKYDKAGKRARPFKRYFKNIEFVRRDYAQCIKIDDPRGLYLTDNFIPTHNTLCAAIKAVSAFVGICFRCKGVPGDLDCPHCHGSARVPQQRILYAAPTDEQVGKFWFEVCAALAHPIALGIFKKDETKKEITVPGTDIKLKAKTAYNPATLRGGTWNGLILEEFQLMKEEAWGEVGIPMLARYRGWCVFIFTPLRLGSDQKSFAKDPRHASKLYKKHLNDKPDENGLQRWICFHGTSHDNPDLDRDALDEMLEDMDMQAYRREILAEDDEIEGLWLVNQAWKESICRIKRFPIPKNWPVKSGHDFGPANTCALFAAEVRSPLPPGTPEYMRAGDVVVFSEYKPQGSRSNKQHVQNWQDISREHRLVKSVGGNPHGEEQIRQGFSDIGWPIYEPLLSNVGAQIEKITRLQENNNLYLFLDETGLYIDFCNMMWELDDDNMPTNRIANESKYHYYAALRYLAPEFDGTPNDYKLPEPANY